MTDPVVWHALHRLADYPVLDALAREGSKALKLGARACPDLYVAAVPRIDWQAVLPSERAFMLLLGIEVRP